VAEGECSSFPDLAFAGDIEKIKAVEAETVPPVFRQYDERAAAFPAVPEHVRRVLESADIRPYSNIIPTQIPTPFEMIIKRKESKL